MSLKIILTNHFEDPNNTENFETDMPKVKYPLESEIAFNWIPFLIILKKYFYSFIHTFIQKNWS